MFNVEAAPVMTSNALLTGALSKPKKRKKYMAVQMMDAVSIVPLISVLH